MNNQLLTEKELSEWCGYSRKGDIESFLRKNGIKFFRGKGGQLMATVGLIEAAKLNHAGNDDFEFEDE